MNQYITNKSQDLVKALDFFRKEIATLRTGRANPSILDNVHVSAYGINNPLNAVGNISVADARSIIITPWDKGVLKEIEKAIITADLGVSVVNEGDKIRVSVSALTEENRKDLVKKLNGKLEESRIQIRKIRDDIKGDIDQAFSDKAISEDDKFRFLKELDEEINKKNDELKNIRDVKEKDIMTI